MRSYRRQAYAADLRAVAAFERQFAPHGGRLRTPDPGAEWYCLRYADYTRRFAELELYRPYLRRLHFDFVQNRDVNAIATQCDGFYLVGCFEGALTNITAFFTFLLSHPGVLPEFGNARGEQPWLRSLARCRWSEPFARILESADLASEPPHEFPLDPTRQLIAHRLAVLAMDFLFFHEVGHIAGGHLDFLGGAGNAMALEEASPAAAGGLAPLDHQALEFNADAHATRVIAQEWLDYPERLPDNHSFATVSEAIDSLVLAMVCLFLMFDPDPTSVDSYDAEHPHPAVRLTNVYFALCQLAERVAPSSLERLDGAWNRGLEHAAQMCAALDVGSAIWHAVQKDQGEIVAAYERIAHRFREIDEHLRPDLPRT